MQPVFMRNLEPINSGQVASANAVEQIERLQQAVKTVIRGKPEAIRLAIVTLIAGGHLLVEDVRVSVKPRSLMPWLEHWTALSNVSIHLRLASV
jgi:hypothetical protein